MGRRVSSPAFVGRGEQLETLAAAHARAGAGEAAVVFIGGDAGVGKTRLVGELERLARAQGSHFLIGGCVDVGGSELPYAPLLAALRPLVRETDPRVLKELVGAGGGDLARLLPELPFTGTDSDVVDLVAQSRLFEALLGLFSRLGRDVPVVLVIEDLHWADPSTRGFLAYLMRNVRGERVLLVATYRSDELSRRHPLRKFLAEIERLPVVERLQLVPFTRRELVEQLAAILGASPDHELVEELFARSQGNAFFAEELLAASGETGTERIPESLREALTLRVEQLSPEARRVVHSVAVAGSTVGHRLLAETAELAEDELARALREAIEENVLVQHSASASYMFRHELVREALYDDLLPGERVALHAALARALEGEPGLAVGAHGAAAQRAMHWSAAHEPTAALAASVQAGIEAEQVWSFAEANAHFEHAVELWAAVTPEQRPGGLTHVELLGRAAETAYLSGQSSRAETLTRSALELIDPARDPHPAGLAHERLARYLLADSARPEALEEYRAAAALLPVDPSKARASILAGEAHILMLQGEPLQARAPCEEALRIAREVGASEVECDALNTLGAALVILGARDEGIEVLRQALHLADELGALEELRRSYINLGQALDDAGRLDEAADLAREGWERLRPRIGPAAAFLAAGGGLCLTRLGRWDESHVLLEEAAEVAGRNWTAAPVLAARAEIEALRGELDAGTLDLRSANRLLPPADVYWMSVDRIPAGQLALAGGHPEELRQIVDLEAAMPQVYPSFLVPLLVLAVRAEAELAGQARAADDEPAERDAVTRARTLVDHARALTGADTWPLGSAPQETLLHVELCELEADRARGESHADAWGEHAARWEHLGRPWAVAYARLREAEAALAENLPRARVSDALEPARAIVTKLRARPLLDAIEIVSRRARIRVNEDQSEDLPSEVAGLTARELDVLRLVAEGRTNAEIGKALFMSPKTASVHVSRILTKLDVKTRTQAAGIAHRLGLVDPSPLDTPT